MICALLFFATAINYIDRQVLSILAPELEEKFGWSESDYGDIVFAFQLAYAVGLVGVGSLMDRMGTRRGFSLAIVVWSLAAMGHAFARSTMGFSLARLGLGLGEAGNFPGATKTVAEWFPKRERALAFGIFNSGSNIGAIAAPLMIPFIAARFGWQWAFLITGGLGFVWVVFWLLLYYPPEQHPSISPEELAYIRSDPPEPSVKVPWLQLLPHRQTWAFALGKLVTDPVWWFMLYWLPKFFKTTYGLEKEQLAIPLIIIYVAADIGSIAGGWISSALLKNGYSVNAARKIALLLCAVCVIPMFFVSYTHNMWVTIAIFSLAAAAHQGWSANLYTLVSDMFPKQAVASVTGFGGMAGAVGGMVAAACIGRVLEMTGKNYAPLMSACSFAYVLSLVVVHLMSPKLEPARFEDSTG